MNGDIWRNARVWVDFLGGLRGWKGEKGDNKE